MDSPDAVMNSSESAPESPVNPVNILVVIPKDDAFERISNAITEMGFVFQHEADFDKAKQIIKREGYRFRVLLVNAAVAEGVTDWIGTASEKYPWMVTAIYTAGVDAAQKVSTGKDLADILQNMLSMSNPNVAFRMSGGAPDPEKQLEDVKRLLQEASGNISSLPLPPYLAGDTRFLKEIKRLLFSVSRTDRPWDLEGDALTLPVGGTSGSFGALGDAWRDELSSNSWSGLIGLVKRKVSSQPLNPNTPIYENFSYTTRDDSIPKSKTLIFATAGDGTSPTVRNAVDACLSAIVLATSIPKCQTLILPVIGGGRKSLPSHDIVRGVLKEFDPDTKLGDLKHVIFTVYEKDYFDQLTKEPEQKISRVQELKNDLPSGDDHLSVESEVSALADAIALKEMHPPLVVGILGGWGTGKSFALHLLRKRLVEIRKFDVTDSAVRENKFPYVGHPYIIHFDAWTYAKDDLWASLMQRILLDLDRQLSLEKTLESANAGLLRKGVDIWQLLDGLSTSKLADLESELGKEAIAAFKDWNTSGDIAEALWGVLQTSKMNEVAALDNARFDLEKAEQEYDKELAKQSQQLEDEIQHRRRVLAQTLEKQQKDDQINIDEKQQQLDLEVSKARADAEREFQIQARNAVWDPVKAKIEAFFGGKLNEAMKKQLNVGDAPVSIDAILKEAGNTKKYINGFLKSGTHVVFLVFAALSFGLPALAEHFQLQAWLGNLFGTTGVLGSALGSIFTVLTKVNGEFANYQKEYQQNVEQSMVQRKEQREHLLQEKMKATEPLQAELNRLKSQLDTARHNLEANEQARHDKEINEQRQKVVNFKEQKTREIQQLKEEVDKHERRAGIIGRGKSLLDIVRERRASRFYDDKLGILHQVQQDLLELTEALMPVNEKQNVVMFDESQKQEVEMFPRGDPRVILVIDDLDRCKPDKVVEVLEAAQLLVKTKLFVVVIAMDVRYVTRALEKVYDRILVRDGDPSGLDYIEKIVQVPYRVPGIAPSVMRSYLQGQMTLEQVDEGTTTVTPETGSTAGQEKETELAGGNPVFESSYDPEAPHPAEPLPDKAQKFNEAELTLLTQCCNMANVSPRAGRRLVNVFKLLKFIWYHRGMHREPDNEVKRVMMFLLALSSVQPVVMRQVLHYLEEEYRENNISKPFQEALIASVNRTDLCQTRPQTISNITEVIQEHGRFADSLTLDTIKLENLRLVKSFSFVGEISHEEKDSLEEAVEQERAQTTQQIDQVVKQAIEDAKTAPETSPTAQKKPKKNPTSRKNQNQKTT